MEFLKLECPNCHAQLSIENGLDTFFCQYCGSKIIISGQNPEIFKAKADVHISDAKNQLERERWEHEFRVQQYRDERKDKSEREGLTILLAIFIASLIFIIIMIAIS